MQNSTRYRKPPLKRTTDSFIDDMKSAENPRIDFGQARSTQIRRDKDKTRNLGVTLYDVDFAIKSFIDQSMKLKVEDNGELIQVPVIYANSEKWASIQKDGFLKDKKGKTLVPLITFRRSSVAIKNELKRNKVASINQGMAYITRQKYNTSTPYDKFSVLYEKKRPSEYFLTPIPDYVDVTYDFIVWCEYQNQLNFLIENFIYFSGQTFGDKNFFKFSTNMDSISIEDSNTTGQDRVVRASFSILAHAYLIPKEIATQASMQRVVTANKLSFGFETIGGLSSLYNNSAINGTTNRQIDRYTDENGIAGAVRGPGGSGVLGARGGVNGVGNGVGNGSSNFRNLNQSGDEANLAYYRRKMEEFIDISENSEPGIYPKENDFTVK
jgi:hypothetical protein